MNTYYSPWRSLGIGTAALFAALLTARSEVVIDGDFTDWASIGAPSAQKLSIDDPSDLPDKNGDIRNITATVEGENLVLGMSVEGFLGPKPEQTAEGKVNRHYYHWILDTDNNPATGNSNAAFEDGGSTGVKKPVGVEIWIQFGWRNGKPDDIYAYSKSGKDEVVILKDYPYTKTDKGITAKIPYAALGLKPGQSIGFAAYQEGQSDGWLIDWVESATLKIPAATGPKLSIDDPSDLPDKNGDIRNITATVEGNDLVLGMTAEGFFGPAIEQTAEGKVNRHYYHWILDTDNNPATGNSNAAFEDGGSTGVKKPVGVEIWIQFGWRNGKPDDIYAYSKSGKDEVVILKDYPYTKTDKGITAKIPYAALGLKPGQSIGFSAYQEGQSDGWLIDWVESETLKIPAATGPKIVEIADASGDLDDASGDITSIRGTTDGTYLYLGMTTRGPITPAVEQTAEGKVNRYYYHWILDTDNNPATGNSNAAFEDGGSTGVKKPVGVEIWIQLGWRNGKPDDVYAYRKNGKDEVEVLKDYEFKTKPNAVEAKLPLAALGLKVGQKIGFSAYQEGQSDGWKIDWVESETLDLSLPGGAADLGKTVLADAYGFTVTLEDKDGAVVDPASVTAQVDGKTVPVKTSKAGALTTVTGVNTAWLPPSSSHRVKVDYNAGSTEAPFDVPFYGLLPSYYGVKALPAGTARGFTGNVTQISEAQANGDSAHGGQSALADLQARGRLLNEAGKPYYNEASNDTKAWKAVPIAFDGTINWSEDAPGDFGAFHATNSGQEDKPFPNLPGSGGSMNGLAVEVLAYLELKAGFHRLGVNTIGGFLASAGPGGYDQLAPTLGVFNGSSNYSYEADHYFNVLAPEDGFYPVRLLYFHQKRTKEGASAEFYSINGAKRVLVNDAKDASSIKAYRFTPGEVTYVSRVTPTPGSTRVKPDAMIEIDITDGGVGLLAGSVELKLNGQAVSPTISKAGAVTTVKYKPAAPFALGSTQTVEVAYKFANNPPTERRESYQLGVFSAAKKLLAEWAAVAGSGADAGVTARSVISSTAHNNRLSAVETQLQGKGDFTATKKLAAINLSSASGGIMGDDQDFVSAGLAADTADNIAIEALLYVQLPAGVHTLGVNSDDGFRLSAGKNLGDTTLLLDEFDGGRGASASGPQNLVDVIAPVNGVYALRLVYFNGGGDASVELYSYDRDSATAKLIGGTEAGAIKAYTRRTAEPGSGTTGGTVVVPVLSGVSKVGAGATSSAKFSFGTTAGKSYEVQYSETLAAGSWSAVSTIAGNGTAASYEDKDATRLAKAKGFYRVLVK